MLASMTRSLRRAARSAELVHAHWLAGAFVASASGRPFVVTLHRTGASGVLDEEHLPRAFVPLVRPVLGRARSVLCVSSVLAAAARRLGARDVRLVPNGLDLPAEIGQESDPPEVLFAGRLVPEKGIEDRRGGRRAPARRRGGRPAARPGARRTRLCAARGAPGLYARAAVVVCPSRSEGFGLVCAEAMAHGRAVVATRVGGLDLVRDGETGLLVEPGDRAALRAAIDRLLADPALRRRLGEAARNHVAYYCGWDESPQDARRLPTGSSIGVGELGSPEPHRGQRVCRGGARRTPWSRVVAVDDALDAVEDGLDRSEPAQRGSTRRSPRRGGIGCCGRPG